MPNPTEREVMALMLKANADLVVSVLRGGEGVEDASVMAAITATRSLSLLVEDTLHALVKLARAEGRTWAEVGELLDVTRQAAFARFGTGSDADDSDDADIAPLGDAEDRARRLIDDFVRGRFERVREAFAESMRQRASLELLKTQRALLQRRLGALVKVGAATTIVRHGLTVVALPLAFELGEIRDKTAFDVDGRVVGFGLLAAEVP